MLIQSAETRGLLLFDLSSQIIHLLSQTVKQALYKVARHRLPRICALKSFDYLTVFKEVRFQKYALILGNFKKLTI